MNFRLSRELAREIFIRERIPAIRFLRDRLQPTGFSPGLSVYRDIVDQVQKGQVRVIKARSSSMAWSSRDTETFLITLEA